MSAFHHAFAQALLAPEAPQDLLLRDCVLHPAFAVYRNTVMKGCIDALEANFPAVARLVGSEWFRSAAAEFVRAHPPADARLLAYGDDGFAAFLQALPSAAGLPWLADVARLDTLWRAVHVAADAPVLSPARLAQDAPELLAHRVLLPHPATRWAWFEGAPVATLWSRNRTGAEDVQPPTWQAEGLLLTRQAGAVRWQALSRGGCALLDACAQRWPLGDAAQHALEAEPGVDVAAVFATLLEAQAFGDPQPVPGAPR